MLPDLSTDRYLRINEIKNYVYCPRISFYALCLRIDRGTVVSQIGIEREVETKRRMKRRKHALHAVHDGVRHFDVEVIYHPMQLIGRLDELIETPAGVYLVDYKDTETDYGYWKIQMSAYRLGIESQGMSVLGCYIYTIPDQAYHEIKIDKRYTKNLDAVVRSLHQMITSEICPQPTPHIQKCFSCQYSRFCNDVL